MKYEIFLSRSRFFWLIGLAGTMIGLFSWFTIPKEEDPRLKNRFGNIQIIYPGASVSDIKKYVVVETEKELASIDAIDKIATTIRSGFAIIQITLKPSIKDDFIINRTWDEVEEAMEKSRNLYPSGVFPPILNRKAFDQEAILISIDAHESVRSRLLVELENELLKDSDVSRIKRLGQTNEEISVLVNEDKLSRSGLTILQLQGQISLANSQISSGYIESGKKRINIKTNNSLDSLEELRRLPIATPNGYSRPLTYFAQIEKRPRGPLSEEMRWNGKSVIGIGVIAKQKIDLRKFGSSVKSIVDKFSLDKNEEGIANEILILNSQPGYVKERLSDLSYSLMTSVFLLSAFMILFMGFRVGISVSIMLPVISLITFGLYTIIGGVLHQIAIAAFVLSFGILIDNIVVVVENVQEKLNQNIDPFHAGLDTIQEFATPLLSSTITTIASFLPMALAKDNSAEFTEAIPKIVILSLIVSYFASIALSPSLALHFLKKKNQRKIDNDKPSLSESIMGGLSGFITNIVFRHKFKTLIMIAILVVSIISLIPFMKFKFFPSADRNQVIMEVSFPEGTSIQYSKLMSTEIESRLSKIDRLKGVVSFIGRSTAYFYYNLPQKPNAPHLIQYILISKNSDFSDDLISFIYDSLKDIGGRIRIKKLEQGPPVEASIVLRVYSKNREEWKEKVLNIAKELKNKKGVTNAWSDSEGLQEELNFLADDKRLVEYGSSRRDLSTSLLKQTYGLNSGYFKSDVETIPIVLASSQREISDISALSDSLVLQLATGSVRAKDISSLNTEVSEAVHHHFNRKSYVSLLVDLEKNINPSGVIKIIEEELEKEGLVAGEDYEFDGEKGNSDDSNNALLETLPIGISILLAALMWEFNSFRLLGIIMTSVPFAFLGMIPGLVFSGQPFGFMPLLALFALIGIAVNNGIILIDRFNTLINDNSLEKAIQTGIQSRLRPIFLTTGSTILGMLPLGFSDSTLWPPFAWAMITGLLVSSVFTLVVVPLLYILIKRNSKGNRLNPKSIAIVVMALSILVSATDAKADSRDSINPDNNSEIMGEGEFIANENESINENNNNININKNIKINIERIGFVEAIELAKDSAKAKAAYHNSAIAKQGIETAKRNIYYPKIGVFAEGVHRDRDLFLSTPVGPAVFGNRTYSQTGLEIYQTLWSPRNIDHLIPSIQKLAESSEKRAVWESKNASYQAINAYIDCVVIKNRKTIAEKRYKNLQILKRELTQLKSRGKIGEIELATVNRNIGLISRSIDDIDVGYNSCILNLGRLLGKDSEVEPIIETIPDFQLPDSYILEKNDREDLQALAIRIESVINEKDFESFDKIPEFYAKGNLNYSDQANLKPFAYSQISVGVKFNLLDGGVSESKAKAKEHEIKSLYAEYKDVKRQIKIQQSVSKNRYIKYNQHLEELELELKRMVERKKVERSRALSGRTSYVDYFQIKDTQLQIEEDTLVMQWELF